jgi:hypothetical protein
MKKLFYRLSSSRPFAKLSSILAMLVLFSGTALATYPSSSPSTSSPFLLSGPPTKCDFFRPDLKDKVQVNFDSDLFGGNPTNVSSPNTVTATGTAVCGIVDGTNTDPTTGFLTNNYAFFNVNIRFNCVTQAQLKNVITYSESFSDLNSSTTLCPNGHPPVEGALNGTATPDKVGDISLLLTYCIGGTPGVTPASDITQCLMPVGIETGISPGNFKKVCPKDSSLGLAASQIFGMQEIVANGQYRPQNAAACYCDGDFNNGDVRCSTDSNPPQPLPFAWETAAASGCEVDWQKTGTESGDTINVSGSPSQVNAAIYDKPSCPVGNINTSTVRVCNNVTPRNFKIQTDQGRLALTFQISEGDCANSLQQPLNDGETRLIYMLGSFNDGTHFQGFDDVTVVVNP